MTGRLVFWVDVWKLTYRNWRIDRGAGFDKNDSEYDIEEDDDDQVNYQPRMVNDLDEDSDMVIPPFLRNKDEF